MRLWHYKLIPALPNKMLISQWRECIAIKRQWEKGTLKHRLVSYVKKHTKTKFLGYVNCTIQEMKSRNIKFNKKYYKEIEEFCIWGSFPIDNYPEHNDRYLKQCFYNLEEKYDRGIINENEWDKILKVAYECDIIE